MFYVAIFSRMEIMIGRPRIDGEVSVLVRRKRWKRLLRFMMPNEPGLLSEGRLVGVTKGPVISPYTNYTQVEGVRSSPHWLLLMKINKGAKYSLSHTTTDFREQGIPSAFPYLS
jgi:hypothetical protein